MGTVEEDAPPSTVASLRNLFGIDGGLRTPGKATMLLQGFPYCGGDLRIVLGKLSKLHKSKGSISILSGV
jgi:hypothetical protein